MKVSHIHDRTDMRSFLYTYVLTCMHYMRRTFGVVSAKTGVLSHVSFVMIETSIVVGRIVYVCLCVMCLFE